MQDSSKQDSSRGGRKQAKPRNQMIWPTTTEEFVPGDPKPSASHSRELAASQSHVVAEHTSFDYTQQEDTHLKRLTERGQENASHSLIDAASTDARASALANMLFSLVHLFLLVLMVIGIYTLNNGGIVFSTFSSLSMHLRTANMLVVQLRIIGWDINGGLSVIAMCALSVLYFATAGFSSFAYYKISGAPLADSKKLHFLWLSSFKYLYFQYVKLGIFFHSFVFLGVILSISSALNCVAVGLADEIDIVGSSVCTAIGFICLALVQAHAKNQLLVNKRLSARFYYLAFMSTCVVLAPCAIHIQMIRNLLTKTDNDAKYALMQTMISVTTSATLLVLACMVLSIFVRRTWAKAEILNSFLILIINVTYSSVYIIDSTLSRFADQQLGLDQLMNP